MTPYMSSALPDPHSQSVFYDGIPAKRFFAWIVDVILILIAMIILGTVTLSIAFFLWPIFWFATSFLYRSLTISAGSATFGMRLMNIQLRGPTGLRLTSQEAMIHSGIYVFGFVLPFVQIFSIGSILLSERHQSLADHFLGTAAINRPR